ncbi:MAG TPA: CBS domain-containing protein [Candidatus Dormibacteraeota bacterium]|nr:CBS domain-containing protein [Candidatus Dormibacteraeota bacterium]
MRSPTLVRDVMRPPVLTQEGTWFRELVRLLRDHDTEFLTVVDHQGRPVGAVTEEDLLLKLTRRWLDEPAEGLESAGRRTERRKAAAVTARELMSEPLLTIAASRPAAEAARLMRERDVRHLAVLDAGGWPAGVVDRSDVLALLLRPDEVIREDVEDLLAHLLRGGAASIGVQVCDGVAILRLARPADVPLEDLLPDVREVEGVLAARVADSTVERWRCPG